MDGPRDYHSKRSKSDKNITYLWNLKKKKENDINELTYKQKQTNRHSQKKYLTVTKGERREG